MGLDASTLGGQFGVLQLRRRRGLARAAPALQPQRGQQPQQQRRQGRGAGSVEVVARGGPGHGEAATWSGVGATGEQAGLRGCPVPTDRRLEPLPTKDPKAPAAAARQAQTHIFALMLGLGDLRRVAQGLLFVGVGNEVSCSAVCVL